MSLMVALDVRAKLTMCWADIGAFTPDTLMHQGNRPRDDLQIFYCDRSGFTDLSMALKALQ